MKQKFFFYFSLAALAISLVIYHPPVQSSINTTNTTPTSQPSTDEGQLIGVQKVIDGDTIILENGEHLRYIGIDTPEEVDPRKPVQCFAKEAADRNAQLLAGHQIRFYHDQNVRDKYGRLLGFVYLEDGTFVNETLVKEGYAFSYPYKPDISKQAQLDEDQTQAQEKLLGLWNACHITQLSSGRYQTNTLK